MLMNQAGINVHDRPVVDAALKRAQETDGPAAALQLHDGRIITGKTSNLLGAASSMLLNALKELAGIEPAVEVVKTVDYESELRLYKVTNLTVANTTPSTFNGTKIEAFIGSLNSKARKELIAGAKEVVTVDRNGNEIFKIEVIK
jgi:uncharacterized protein (UPF0371 family)